MTIGGKIKEIRQSKKISRVDLASSVGISTQSLYKIEESGASPRTITLGKIAEALGVTVSYLVFCCIAETDVPSEKRDAFKVMRPVILDLFSK